MDGEKVPNLEWCIIALSFALISEKRAHYVKLLIPIANKIVYFKLRTINKGAHYE